MLTHKVTARRNVGGTGTVSLSSHQPGPRRQFRCQGAWRVVRAGRIVPCHRILAIIRQLGIEPLVQRSCKARLVCAAGDFAAIGQVAILDFSYARLRGSGWRVAGGGWRVAGGGWRVAGSIGGG